MLTWNTKQTNDIPTNPLDCYWAVGFVGNNPRLYKIVEQHPTDVNGLRISDEVELYVLFEEIGGRKVSEVFTNEKELQDWKRAQKWGEFWFKGDGRFVHAYKTLDDAKARAETQISHIQNLIDCYFPKEHKTNE